MIKWLLNWLKSKLGHWLLEDEEEAERERETARKRRMEDIINANYTTDDTIRDLDDGKF